MSWDQPGDTTFPSSTMPALWVTGDSVYVTSTPELSGIVTGWSANRRLIEASISSSFCSLPLVVC